MGRNTAAWRFQNNGVTVIAAVDYPFLGWHELTNCYEAQGCVISERSILTGDANFDTVTCEIMSPSGATGQLWYSEFLESGESLVPLTNNAGSGQFWLSRIQTSLLRQTASFRSNPSNYQVQLLVYHRKALSETQKIELLRLHRETAKRIVQVIQEATAQ